MIYNHIILFQVSPNRWEDIFNVFFDISNPVYISIFAGIIFSFFIFFTYRYIVFPLQRKFQKEKENLELEAARLMALFAELDPDPVIRINSEGKIIITNLAAENVLGKDALRTADIKKILSLESYNTGKIIEENKSVTLTRRINNKFYSILIRGNSALNIAQIYFRDISEQKSAEKKLKESESQLKELSDHLQDIIEAERSRISASLHDGLGQSLSLMRLNLYNIIEGNSEEYFRDNRQNLINLLDATIKELKDISYGLKPKLLEQMGLEFAVERLVNSVASEMKIKGSFNVEGRKKRLSPKIELILFRITQEALNNIIKHSEASEFNVHLFSDKELIRMIISDNGKGFSTSRSNGKHEKVKGMGLLNIRERISSLNGVLKIESSKDNGTMIVIEIPAKDTTWQKKKE